MRTLFWSACRLAQILLIARAGACAVVAEAITKWAGPEVTLLGTPSPDGKLLSYVDPATRALAVREIDHGRSRIIVRPPEGSKEFAYFSTISPDARQIAYAWFNDEGFYDLRVVALDGSQPRVLYRNEEAGFVQPCAWSPDGKQILTLFFRKDNISQIALAPAAGGPMKVLRSLNWVYPKKMDFSPDGRFIVYDSFAAEGSGDRTVFALSVDGATETKLIDRSGNHLFPLWTPDGKGIVFASDVGGTMDMWTIDVSEGRPRGEPRLLKRDVGRILPMGLTRSGEYFYGVRTGASDVYITSLDGSAKPQRATLRFPERNSAPAWSPDGQSLAYLSRRGTENFGQESRVIVIRSLASNNEREVAPSLAHLERVSWSPDGRSLLVSGSDNKGRGGLYVVDATTAAVKPVIAEAGASFRGFEGVWAGTILYLKDNELRTEQGSVLYKGDQLSHLALSPDRRHVAVAGRDRIAVAPISGGVPRMIAFPGLTDLAWGRDLLAGRGAELWRVPVDGRPPEKLPSPGNRTPGFSAHPDGRRIALTAGQTRSEVRVLELPRKLEVPPGLDAYMPVPPENPLTPAKVALGRKLFFDARLSRDKSVSCATCHDPKLAFTDARKVAQGIAGRTGDRRVPRIVNRGYGKRFFWDGRAASLEEQVIQPIENPKEMDFTAEQAAARVGIDKTALQQALASYVRTILSGDSPYDRYLAGDKSALTEQQRAGLRLFRGKAGCAVCHLGPNFSDEKFHNTGVGWPHDEGRSSVSKREQDRGAFKTPSLREAARTPPYMHDGSLATLDEVVDYYDKGGTSNPVLDPEIRKLNLTPAEKAALVAFLNALTGTVRDGL